MRGIQYVQCPVHGRVSGFRTGRVIDQNGTLDSTLYCEMCDKTGRRAVCEIVVPGEGVMQRYFDDDQDKKGHWDKEVTPRDHLEEAIARNADYRDIEVDWEEAKRAVRR